MEKKTGVAIGILAVVIIGLILFGTGITGGAVACSSVPTITNIYTTGDQLIVHWTDSGKFQGQGKYEVLVYRQEEEAEMIRKDYVKEARYGNSNLPIGTYFVKVRAKNNKCGPEYTDYVTSDMVQTTAA